MIICPRCATRLKADSPICPICGAGPIASFQEDSDAPTGQPPGPADLTPRINTFDIRSRLSQNALAWGFFSAIGICLLIAVYATLFGEGVWFGCAVIVFVAPCAGLLGALGFSMLAESLQVLIRPLIHTLDPRARRALCKIKRGAEEDGADVIHRGEASEAVYLPQSRRERDGDESIK
jgi:hypothetical protein